MEEQYDRLTLLMLIRHASDDASAYDTNVILAKPLERISNNWKPWSLAIRSTPSLVFAEIV
jgi:hypothetical protein